MKHLTARRLKVDAPGGGYPVIIGSGVWEKSLLKLLKRRRSSGLCLVTDSEVYRHHGKRLLSHLRRAGFAPSTSVVPAGERSKSVRQLEQLWRSMVRSGCDRESCVVALGGGVAGDLAGFAAATVLRGVDLIQMPTTLLAMVDASVGGKTGINLPEGKNLVGAFHQPRAVIADLDFLGTLPERELRAGWAEVIKTAAIRDFKLFRELERNRKPLHALRPRHLLPVVARCVSIKAEVVRKDERESGLRRILNFGHTLAHGLEAVERYGGLLHGEAVAVGMVFAAELGEALGYTARSTVSRLEALLKAYGLPTRIAGLAPASILNVMARDKKRGPEGLRWVFLSRLGSARVVEKIPMQVVKEVLQCFLNSETYTRHSSLGAERAADGRHFKEIAL